MRSLDESKVLHKKNRKSILSLSSSMEDMSYDEKKEHCLSISFMIHESRFTCAAVPIDREGAISLDMQQKFGRMGSAASSSLSSSSSSSTSASSSSASSVIKRQRSIRMSRGSRRTRKAIDAKYDIPFISAIIAMKSDGGRDILLQTIFSVRNETLRTFYLKFTDKYKESKEYALPPGACLCLPANMAHPLTCLHVRFDAESDWILAVQRLEYFIEQGNWNTRIL
jgi:hypothetical protein